MGTIESNIRKTVGLFLITVFVIVMSKPGIADQDKIIKGTAKFLSDRAQKILVERYLKRAISDNKYFKNYFPKTSKYLVDTNFLAWGSGNNLKKIISGDINNILQEIIKQIENDVDAEASSTLDWEPDKKFVENILLIIKNNQTLDKIKNIKEAKNKSDLKNIIFPDETEFLKDIKIEELNKMLEIAKSIKNEKKENKIKIINNFLKSLNSFIKDNNDILEKFLISKKIKELKESLENENDIEDKIEELGKIVQLINSKKDRYVSVYHAIKLIIEELKKDEKDRSYINIISNIEIIFTNCIVLDKDEKFRERTAFKRFKKYAKFFARLADANEEKDVVAIWESAVLSINTYQTKREDTFSIFINSYVGFTGGYINDDQYKHHENLYGGIFAPIGIDLSFSGRGFSYGLFFPVVDFGNVINAQIKESTEKFTYSKIISLGGYFVLGWQNSPVSFGAGGQYGRQLRSSSGSIEKEWRANFFIALDMPLFNVY